MSPLMSNVRPQKVADRPRRLLTGKCLMTVSREEIKQTYESQETEELIDRYINGDLTEAARSVLSECLISRGEKLQALDELRARLPALLNDEEKKGEHSMFNFRRQSTQLAFLVGLPFYLYLHSLGWSVGPALMVSVLPLWAIFRITEHIRLKKKTLALPNSELTNIAEARTGNLGYELQKIAKDELKRRSSGQ